jgi:hypothetical protein
VKGSKISMSKSITLASGAINLSDEISVELIAPPGWPYEPLDPAAATEEPARVVISWPNHGDSVTTPAKFAEVASAAMKILAAATVELSRIKAGKRLR